MDFIVFFGDRLPKYLKKNKNEKKRAKKNKTLNTCFKANYFSVLFTNYKTVFHFCFSKPIEVRSSTFHSLLVGPCTIIKHTHPNIYLSSLSTEPSTAQVFLQIYVNKHPTANY